MTLSKADSVRATYTYLCKYGHSTSLEIDYSLFVSLPCTTSTISARYSILLRQVIVVSDADKITRVEYSDASRPSLLSLLRVFRIQLFSGTRARPFLSVRTYLSSPAIFDNKRITRVLLKCKTREKECRQALLHTYAWTIYRVSIFMGWEMTCQADGEYEAIYWIVNLSYAM